MVRRPSVRVVWSILMGWDITCWDVLSGATKYHPQATVFSWGGEGISVGVTKCSSETTCSYWSGEGVSTGTAFWSVLHDGVVKVSLLALVSGQCLVMGLWRFLCWHHSLSSASLLGGEGVSAGNTLLPVPHDGVMQVSPLSPSAGVVRVSVPLSATNFCCHGHYTSFWWGDGDGVFCHFRFFHRRKEEEGSKGALPGLSLEA